MKAKEEAAVPFEIIERAAALVDLMKNDRDRPKVSDAWNRLRLALLPHRAALEAADQSPADEELPAGFSRPPCSPIMHKDPADEIERDDVDDLMERLLARGDDDSVEAAKTIRAYDQELTGERARNASDKGERQRNWVSCEDCGKVHDRRQSCASAALSAIRNTPQAIEATPSSDNGESEK